MKTYTNPYAAGTANSSLFRIPSVITLKSGRILAGADIRYGNGTDDPANIETAVRYSDDNGKTWSEPCFVNHFDDMEDEDYNVAIPTSASFIDSALVQDESGRIYHACDACPAYMGLWSAGTYGKGSGYIDGKLVLCALTSPDKAESTTLDKAHYPYYIDSFGEDNMAPVRKFADNEIFENYYVDRDYCLYKAENGTYSPVIIKQMKKDGVLSDKDIKANVFYAYSPLKLYPTYYLWIKTSDDNGETWSYGKIINTEIDSRGFTGFSPGRGLSVNMNGTNRVIFTIYDNNDRTEYTSVIYTDNGGETWKRSKKANKVGLAGKSSESQMVLLHNNTIRMFSRNIAGYIGYCDSTDFGESWGKYTLDKALSYCSNCQFSIINYSKEIDGKSAVVISYPAEKIRKRGVIKVGTFDEGNRITWSYSKKITTTLKPFTYIYSCITELPDGRIFDLYESDKAALSTEVFEIKELMVKEKTALSFTEKISSRIKNLKK